ncbi:MAG: hypothetical protein AB7F23_08865 [Phycisphaerae bacterium]|jgi:hypothetical protein
MAVFCEDKDLLAREAMLFTGQYLRQFTLLTGGGATLSGGVLLCGGVDFVASAIGVGNVVYLSEPGIGFEGFYEVLECVAANEIHICPLRESSGPIRPTPTIGSLALVVMSFEPVAEFVDSRLRREIGMLPEVPRGQFGEDDISITPLLRDTAVCGVLEQLFLSARTGTDDSLLLEKGDQYAMMYERSLRRLIVQMENETGSRTVNGRIGDFRRG